MLMEIHSITVSDGTESTLASSTPARLPLELVIALKNNGGYV